MTGPVLAHIAQQHLRRFLRSEMEMQEGVRAFAALVWNTIGERRSTELVENVQLRLMGMQRSRPLQQTYFIGLFERARLRYVKIGFSDRPKQRLEALLTSSPFDLRLLAAIPSLFCAEEDLHHRFRGCRHEREWFRATPRLRGFIAEVQEFQGRAGWLWVADPVTVILQSRQESLARLNPFNDTLGREDSNLQLRDKIKERARAPRYTTGLARARKSPKQKPKPSKKHPRKRHQPVTRSKQHAKD
jgi:hypothetical protein